MNKFICTLSLSLFVAMYGYTQNLSIQYNPTTKKGFFQKEIAVMFGDEQDIKKRATAWANQKFGSGNFEGKSIWDKFIKGSGVYPNGITISDKKQTLAYDYYIEISKSKCTITITNIINRDQLLFNDIERHAFKEDGTRRTNLTRLEIMESVEKSMTELIKSLEKEVTKW